MAFVIRQFNYEESLGKKLKAIRTSAGFTLSELSSRTKIRKAFLQAFETGQYGKLPDPVYARNFLKIYVRALGADVDYFLNQFEAECGTCDFMKNARLPRSRTRPLQFLVASRFVKIFSLLLVGLGIVTYLGLQVRAIVSAPDLIVFEPVDGALTQDAMVTVTGRAQDDARVQINGNDVLLSVDGTFETKVALERGLNVISIESQKRYSKPTLEYRRVILQNQESVSFFK